MRVSLVSHASKYATRFLVSSRPYINSKCKLKKVRTLARCSNRSCRVTVNTWGPDFPKTTSIMTWTWKILTEKLTDKIVQVEKDTYCIKVKQKEGNWGNKCKRSENTNQLHYTTELGEIKRYTTTPGALLVESTCTVIGKVWLLLCNLFQGIWLNQLLVFIIEQRMLQRKHNGLFARGQFRTWQNKMQFDLGWKICGITITRFLFSLRYC